MFNEEEFNNYDVYEPPANWREFGVMARNMYVSLRKEGFSEHQAMTLLGIMVQTIAANGVNDEEED